MNGTNQILDRATGRPVNLLLQDLKLEGEIYPFGGVVRVVHHFQRTNSPDPMEIVYVAMLPRGATLRRFKIVGPGFEKESKLQKREKATAAYDKGLDRGHVSSLAEIGEDGMVSLFVGQVRSYETIRVALEIVLGVEKVNGGIRFRFPFTLAPTYRASTTTIQGDNGRFVNPFSSTVLPMWTGDSKKLHNITFALRVHEGVGVKSVASPSHRITVENCDPDEGGGAFVSLAGFGDTPNRDLVLDVAYKKAGTPVLFQEVASEEDTPGPHWTAMFPTNVFPSPEKKARRVCIVLDRSGSMCGVHMEQAKAGVLAVLSALTKEDKFGLIAFDTQLDVLSPTLLQANKQGRQHAVNFLGAITARGGTELGPALTAALATLKGKGEIFLLTDGDVSGAQALIQTVRGQGVRLHILGINTASQDRLLHELASSTGGVSRMVSGRENVGVKALTLFNAVARPVLRGAKASLVGNGPPVEVDLGDVWENVPVLLRSESPVPVRVTIEGNKGKVKVGFTDLYSNIVRVPAGVLGLLYGAEQILALERLADASGKDKDKRKLRDASRKYGLASKEMSLVAVVTRKGDKHFKGKEVEQEVVKLGTPEDFGGAASRSYGGARALSFGGATMDWMGDSGRGIAISAGGRGRSRTPSDPGIDFPDDRDYERGVAPAGMAMLVTDALNSPGPATTNSGTPLYPGGGWGSVNSIQPLTPVQAAVVRPSMADQVLAHQVDQNMTLLLARLADLCEDGGVGGNTIQDRVLETIQLALAASMADEAQDVFGAHLERMAAFLEASAPQMPEREDFILRVVAKLRGEPLDPASLMVEGMPRSDIFPIDDRTPVWGALEKLVGVA